MPLLAELQCSFARGVLTGTAPAIGFAEARVPAAAALRQHRNTVMGALTGALRLSYPSVDALVGEAFFDQAASAFAEVNPPATARLSGYGEGFADFIAAQAPSLPYLRDVARLDWAIERALLAANATRRFTLDGAIAIALPVSLSVLRLDYPADVIKGALGDNAALGAIDLTPAPRWVLVWRSGRQARVCAVSGPAATFLEILLSGAGAQAAFAVASAQSQSALQILKAEVFAASFCTVLQGKTS